MLHAKLHDVMDSVDDDAASVTSVKTVKKRKVSQLQKECEEFQDFIKELSYEKKLNKELIEHNKELTELNKELR